MLFSRLFLARRAVSQLQVSNSSIHLSALHRNMDLKQVVKTLESLAPTSLAESWDNVGLLIEPASQKNVKVLLVLLMVVVAWFSVGASIMSIHYYCVSHELQYPGCISDQ